MSDPLRLYKSEARVLLKKVTLLLEDFQREDGEDLLSLLHAHIQKTKSFEEVLPENSQFKQLLHLQKEYQARAKLALMLSDNSTLSYLVRFLSLLLTRELVLLELRILQTIYLEEDDESTQIIRLAQIISL